MNQTTRCPACQTLFKIHPEQIESSKGWVRCGKCDEVFNALAASPEAQASDSASTAVPTEENAHETTPDKPESTAQSDAADTDANWDNFLDEVKNWQAERDQPLPRADGVDPDPLDEDLPDDEQPTANTPETSRTSELLSTNALPEQDSEPTLSGFVAEEEARLQELTAKAEAADAEKDAAELSFMRNAKKRAFWRRKSVRALLALGILLLLAALAGQLAIHNRQQLAAINPTAKHWMQRLCTYANCTITPLQNVNALAIESSSLQVVAPQTYELTWSVRNNAKRWIQAPAVEISLLDNRNETVIRQTLTADQLGQPAELPPQSLHPVTVGLETQGKEIAGYRLHVFYP